MRPYLHGNHGTQSTNKMLIHKSHLSMLNQALDEHERTHKFEILEKQYLKVLSQLTMYKVVYYYFFVTPSELMWPLRHLIKAMLFFLHRFLIIVSLKFFISSQSWVLLVFTKVCVFYICKRNKNNAFLNFILYLVG